MSNLKLFAENNRLVHQYLAICKVISCSLSWNKNRNTL